MSNVILPPAPYLSPMTDGQGVMTPIWAKWINQLYLRAGGASAPSNGTFASQSSVTALQTSVTSLETSVTALNTEVSTNTSNITTLTNEVNGLSVGRQL